MMKLLNKNITWIILLLLLILPFFILSFYVFPSADDFSNFNLLQKFGFGGYQHYMYMNWTGRYAANFIESLSPLNNLFMYRLIPFLLLVLLFCSVYVLFRTFLRSFLTSSQLILFSLVFFAIYLNTFPSTGEGIYWFPAGVEYLTANILTLLFIASTFKIAKSESKQKQLFFMVSLLLSFVISGLNEISLLLVTIITFFIILGDVYLKRKFSLWLSVLFICNIAFGVFEMMAPGNYMRMSAFPGAMDILPSIVSSFWALIKLLGIHFQNPPFILLSFLMIPAGSVIIQEYNIRMPFRIRPYLLLLLSLVILYCLYFPGFFSMGINPPMRVNALLSLVFMLLWFLNLLNLSHRLVLKNTSIPQFPDVVVKILLISIVILCVSDFYKEPGKALYFRSNIPAAYYDLFTKATDYKEEMQQREAVFGQAKAEKKNDVVLDSLKSIPQTIFFVDITADSSHWMNRNYAKYRDIKSVRLKK